MGAADRADRPRVDVRHPLRYRQGHHPCRLGEGVAEVLVLLRKNAAWRIAVAGHTDNVGAENATEEGRARNRRVDLIKLY